MSKCLVGYDQCEKAEILESANQEKDPMPRRRKSAAKSKRRRGRKSIVARRSKVRVVRGRVGIKVPGYSTLQYVPSSQIVRLIPLSRLRLAAKRILGKPLKSKKRVRRGRKKGRSRKSRR